MHKSEALVKVMLEEINFPGYDDHVERFDQSPSVITARYTCRLDDLIQCMEDYDDAVMDILSGTPEEIAEFVIGVNDDCDIEISNATRSGNILKFTAVCRASSDSSYTEMTHLMKIGTSPCMTLDSIS